MYHCTPVRKLIDLSKDFENLFERSRGTLRPIFTQKEVKTIELELKKICGYLERLIIQDAQNKLNQFKGTPFNEIN